MNKDQKKEGNKPGPKKTFPLTEDEKVARAKIDKLEKELEEAQKKVKEIMAAVREKESTRKKLRIKILDSTDALRKIHEQMDEKRQAQRQAFDKAQQYIDALRKRKNRRADEREELLKILPHGSELPPLRTGDEEDTDGVSDYDRAIKIVQQEIQKVEFQHSTSSFTKSSERKMMGREAGLRAVIEKIKELERNAAAPLADLAEVDVMGCLETCRKLKAEIAELNASSVPHYKAIADAMQQIEQIRASIPKILEERNALFAQVKEIVMKLQEANFEMDKARFKAQQARNQKRREELANESAAIKARIEEAKKRREAMIEKALNTLPFEREVAAAKELIAYLRSIALPGTCGIPENTAPKTKSQPAQPTLTSAPSVELEEASFGATEMVVSRKTVAVPKVAKKANKKKAAQQPKKAEPKKKTAEDSVRVAPTQFHRFEILSLSAPETYGEVEARYNEIKEKLEGFEKVRAEAKEQREKSIQEAEKKAQEEAAKKAEEREAAKAEAEKPKEEEPKAEEPAAAEAPAAEPVATEEPAAESQ